MSASLARIALVVLTTASCISAEAQTPASTEAPAKPNDYGSEQSWLCRPGRKDACAVDLTTTVLAPDGKLQREAFAGSGDPAIDCFYVYPTVSRDLTRDSDMETGLEERSVVQQQFARFAGQCRLYAPVYRQRALAGLRGTIPGNMSAFYGSLGYEDVVDAWNHYLKYDNRNRGVVLIGHSQGAAILEQLVAKHIEGKPVQSRLVSALLIGTPISVPRSADVGGTFKRVPLCRSAKQVGCIITYASFRANVPPRDQNLFTVPQDRDTVAACTNPAALGGGSGALLAYLSSKRTDLGAGNAPLQWATPVPSIETPFVSVPGLLRAQCVTNENGSYLEIQIDADPRDARTDEIAGDVVIGGELQPGWGLHLIDVNLAMGNLVEIVAAQSKAYLAKKRS